MRSFQALAHRNACDSIDKLIAANNKLASKSAHEAAMSVGNSISKSITKVVDEAKISARSNQANHSYRDAVKSASGANATPLPPLVTLELEMLDSGTPTVNWGRTIMDSLKSTNLDHLKSIKIRTVKVLRPNRVAIQVISEEAANAIRRDVALWAATAGVKPFVTGSRRIVRGVIHDIPRPATISDIAILEELQEDLIDKLDSKCRVEDIKISFLGERKTKAEHGSVLVEALVPHNSTFLDFSSKSILILYKRCRVAAFDPKRSRKRRVLCFKCRGYGHKSNECPNSDKCRHCGGPHDSRQCQEKQSVRRSEHEVAANKNNVVRHGESARLDDFPTPAKIDPSGVVEAPEATDSSKTASTILPWEQQLEDLEKDIDTGNEQQATQTEEEQKDDIAMEEVTTHSPDLVSAQSSPGPPFVEARESMSSPAKPVASPSILKTPSTLALTPRRLTRSLSKLATSEQVVRSLGTQSPKGKQRSQ